MIGPSPSLRKFVAAVAIALQASDAVVGVAGHSHDHAVAACCSPAAHEHAPGGCSHRHGIPDDGDEEGRPENGSSESSPAGPHEDCTLCRHVSQPVAIAAFVVAPAGTEQCEVFVPLLVSRLASAPATIHAARGPPCFLG